jgi:hypothetical protein
MITANLQQCGFGQLSEELSRLSERESERDDVRLACWRRSTKLTQLDSGHEVHQALMGPP